MGIEELRKIKAGKTGTVLSVAEARKILKHPGKGTKEVENRFKSGKYETAKGAIYFRSLWEVNWALYLDWLVKQGEIKDWQYEADIFFFDKIKMGTQNYRPDFKIFNNDGSIHYDEVKGYMDAVSKTRLKRMKKYHPDVKIVLVERKQYSEMIRKMKVLIKFYD